MTKRRLLIIEDDKRIADLVALVATDAGFAISIASKPHEIEEACQTFKPEVLVMDLLMPDMDGLEVLQLFHRQFSQARIVIISGSDESSRAMAERMGEALGFIVDANLAKPFSVADIKAVFDKIRASLDSTELALQAN